MANEIQKMVGYAIAFVGLTAITLTGIAVINGYKDSYTVDNDTADKFIAGLAIFATFSTIVALTIVGKIIVGLFKGGKYS